VALSAPGHDLLAAYPFHGDARDASSSEYVTDITGTSAAAPLVSGAAALLKSLRPDWKAPQIRAQLIATADSIDPVQVADVRYKLGGRLNVGRAVSALGPREAPASVSAAGRTFVLQKTLAFALSKLGVFLPSFTP